MDDTMRKPAASLRIVRTDETLRGKTVIQLREAILNQFFKPGERLVENNLCNLTGVSRTTIREALRQLETEGLVDVIPQRGPVVASLNRDDAKNIYELREGLEGLAARLFVERASDEEIDDLAAAARRCAKAISERNGPESAEGIDAFTNVLFEGARNSLIASTMQTLRARLHYLRAMTTPRQTDEQIAASIKNIERIVDCVRQRDASGASEACVARVRNAAVVGLAIMDADRQSQG